jgi:hypothetical protein
MKSYTTDVPFTLGAMLTEAEVADSRWETDKKAIWQKIVGF